MRKGRLGKSSRREGMELSYLINYAYAAGLSHVASRYSFPVASQLLWSWAASSWPCWCDLTARDELVVLHRSSAIGLKGNMCNGSIDKL